MSWIVISKIKSAQLPISKILLLSLFLPQKPNCCYYPEAMSISVTKVFPHLAGDVHRI